MESTLPLAEKLNIAAEEVESMKKKIAFAISVGKDNRPKEEHITKIYEEWATVAKRMKKGRQMIEDYYTAIPNAWDRENNQKYIKLCNLYYFLMAVLGFYDSFFKHVLSREHYRHLMNGILELISD